MVKIGQGDLMGHYSLLILGGSAVAAFFWCVSSTYKALLAWRNSISIDDPCTKDQKAFRVNMSVFPNPQEWDSPFEVFAEWFRVFSEQTNMLEPTAMFLSTVSSDGQPSGRIVLLKGWSPKGFRFYTNYESRKGSEIKQNSQVSLTFYWDSCRKQIRIEGEATLLSAEESDQYFATRLRTSQLGAWVSRQSQKITGRKKLEAELRHIEMRFPDKVPRPPFWGGYNVVPHRFEFWSSGEARLHDRTVFVRLSESKWQQFCVSP